MTTPVEDACRHCELEVPDNFEICPHCYFVTPPTVNVRRASRSAERAALQARYDKAFAATADRAEAIRAFEAEVAQAKAVMVLSLNKLMPLARGNLTIYPAYADLANLRFSRCHNDVERPNWDVRRVQAEAELLGGMEFIGRLHYAALSTNGSGLTSYSEGDAPVTATLREKMIASRASVFEMNSGLYLERGRSKFPAGWRATWEERGKLGIAKLAKRITKDTQSAKFARILLSRGATSLNDKFIEVHIFGTMTVSTFEKIVVTATPPSPTSGRRARPNRGKTIPKVLRDDCNKAGTYFEQHHIPFEIE